MPDAQINIAAMATLLNEIYQEAVELELASTEDIRQKIFRMGKMDRRTVRKTSIGDFPRLPEFGGQLLYARPYEQYDVAATARTFAAGLRITQEMIEDDLSSIMDGDHFRRMTRGVRFTMNAHAAEVFNFMNTNNTAWYTRGEGVAVVSNTHTTRTPNISTAEGFDNLILDTLSPTAVSSARVQFRLLRGDTGEFRKKNPNELWVNPTREDRALEIIKTPQFPDDARNAVNPQQNRFTVHVLDEWDSTENWALCNREARLENVEWLDYVPVDHFKIKEFDTFEAKWAVRGRWTFRVFDWGWIVGAVAA